MSTGKPLIESDSQADREAKTFGESGQERSLERGESIMNDDEVNETTEDMDPLDSHLLSHAEDLNETDEMADEKMTDKKMARKNGQAGEDEANSSEHVYGQGRMDHGVDLDAPADSGTFGDPDDDRPDERLAGNER